MTQFQMKTFDWRPVHDTTVFPANVLAGMSEPEEALFWDEVRKRMIYGMRTGVLSYELPGHIAKREHTVIYHVPTSSWQMFKEEHQGAWWMRWLVTRRPALRTAHTRRIEFEAEWKDYAVYPWQSVAPTLPRLGTPVRHVQLMIQVDEKPEAPARGHKAGAS